MGLCKRVYTGRSQGERYPESLLRALGPAPPKAAPPAAPESDRKPPARGPAPKKRQAVFSFD